MSRKTAQEILMERETRYRNMARAAERSAARSQDVYARTVYLSLAEGWLGFANRIAAELKQPVANGKDNRTRAYKSDVSIGGRA
jgi:hypothetical protein